jgi:molecular chaperone DnaJ|tara:strand:+ start:5918 stop:6850 length:933 start_codon:yes stop_codon:yes gene_type:complete
MNAENYYDILGVTEESTQEDIKKAYRMLAKENHPDKGGDEELFKKISVAYDTIGDESKRKQYDIQRKNPFGNMGGGSTSSFSDLFNMAFGQQRQQRNHTTNINLELTPVESYLGITKEILFQRKGKCDPCDGTGGDKVVCPTCGGSGSVVRKMGNGMFIQMVSMSCGGCNGTGSMIKNACYVCNGTGDKNEMKKVEVNVPHGIDDGQFFRLQGVGDFRNGVYGDLVVRIFMKNDNNFEKFVNNLVYNKFFTLNDLTGDNFEIPHPDGTIKISFPKNIDTSKPLRVKGKGYTIDGEKGDLLINQFLRYNRN